MFIIKAKSGEAAETVIRIAERNIRRNYTAYGFKRINTGKSFDSDYAVTLKAPELIDFWAQRKMTDHDVIKFFPPLSDDVDVYII